MARIPMVTRTITSTQATVLAVDITCGEAFNKTIALPRTYKDKETLLKKAKKMFDTDEEKIVSVVDVEEQEALYGMPEQQFIELAEQLPPREAE